MHDSKWFSDRYGAWYDQICGFLFVILQSRGRLDLQSEISDCAQEALMVLWDKRMELKDHPNINAWLLKTASNILKNKLASTVVREKHTAFSLDETFSDGSESVINRIDLTPKISADERKAELLDVIREEVGDETYVFLLSYYDKEQKTENLMDRYRLSSSGIRMKVKRVLDQFRRRK